MKDYERLTNPNLEEYYPKHDFCLGCEHFENHTCNRWNGTCANYEDFNRVYDRLYDLEDKIECGEIDYIADKDKEIARLTAENERLIKQLSERKCVYLSDSETAEGCVQSPCPNYKTVEDILKENARLHARLEKAVELPCKVGDTVWCIRAYGTGYQIEENSVIEIVFEYGNNMKIKTSRGLFGYDKWTYGLDCFTDRAKAEAELKGGEGE